MWTVFVGLVRLAMITAAHLTGGSIGSGILLVSAAVRLALLPLTLRAAREARANPGKPGRAQLQSALVQMPLLGALVSAVRGGFAAGTRFLWIRDLSQPSVMLAGLVASLSVAIAATAPRGANQPHAPAAILLISGALTLAFLWSASSALTLSVGAGSAVSLVQNWLVARQQPRDVLESK